MAERYLRIDERAFRALVAHHVIQLHTVGYTGGGMYHVDIILDDLSWEDMIKIIQEEQKKSRGRTYSGE